MIFVIKYPTGIQLLCDPKSDAIKHAIPYPHHTATHGQKLFGQLETGVMLLSKIPLKIAALTRIVVDIIV